MLKLCNDDVSAAAALLISGYESKKNNNKRWETNFDNHCESITIKLNGALCSVVQRREKFK